MNFGPVGVLICCMVIFPCGDIYVRVGKRSSGSHLGSDQLHLGLPCNLQTLLPLRLLRRLYHHYLLPCSNTLHPSHALHTLDAWYSLDPLHRHGYQGLHIWPSWSQHNHLLLTLQPPRLLDEERGRLRGRGRKHLPTSHRHEHLLLLSAQADLPSGLVEQVLGWLRG